MHCELGLDSTSTVPCPAGSLDQRQRCILEWWQRQRCLFLVGTTSTTVPTLGCYRYRAIVAFDLFRVFFCGSGKFQDNFELHLPFSWDFFIFMIHQNNFSILYRLNGHSDIKQRKLQSSIHNFYLENAFIPQNPHNITSFIHHHLNDCQKKAISLLPIHIERIYIAFKNHSQWIFVTIISIISMAFLYCKKMTIYLKIWPQPFITYL